MSRDYEWIWKNKPKTGPAAWAYDVFEMSRMLAKKRSRKFDNLFTRQLYKGMKLK